MIMLKYELNTSGNDANAKIACLPASDLNKRKQIPDEILACWRSDVKTRKQENMLDYLETKES